MKNILCFGDSNTYGIIPGTWDRYDSDSRYPGILRSLLKNFNIIEDGVVGRTSIYPDHRPGRIGINDIDESIKNANPNYMVIMLGTNDLKKINAKSLSELNEALDKLLSHVIKYDTKVILVNPATLDKNIEKLDFDFDFNSYEISKSAKSVYESLAKKYDFHFLDANTYATVGVDGEHITSVGHKALANAIYELILKLEGNNNESNTL